MKSGTKEGEEGKDGGENSSQIDKKLHEFDMKTNAFYKCTEDSLPWKSDALYMDGEWREKRR